MRLKRTFLAFVLAPLATPLVFISVWLVTGTIQFNDISDFFLLISFFAYSAAIIFGIPLVLITRGKRSTRVVFGATGAVAGLLMATAFSWSIFDPRFYLLCVVASSLSGLAFWAVYFWQAVAEEVND